jgi:hypothetical protein
LYWALFQTSSQLGAAIVFVEDTILELFLGKKIKNEENTTKKIASE